jgi:hypothetical protein
VVEGICTLRSSVLAQFVHAHETGENSAISLSHAQFLRRLLDLCDPASTDFQLADDSDDPTTMKVMRAFYARYNVLKGLKDERVLEFGSVCRVSALTSELMPPH